MRVYRHTAIKTQKTIVIHTGMETHNHMWHTYRHPPLHTHTHFTLYSLKSPIKLLFSKHNSRGSRIPCANRTWWRAKKKKEKTVWCGAASHSLMTSPERYAALVFPLPSSPSSPHTCTESETERGEGELSSSFASAAPPAYTSNLGHVQGRHNPSHHSSTRAKFKNPALMQTVRKCSFCIHRELPALEPKAFHLSAVLLK